MFFRQPKMHLLAASKQKKFSQPYLSTAEILVFLNFDFCRVFVAICRFIYLKSQKKRNKPTKGDEKATQK